MQRMTRSVAYNWLSLQLRLYNAAGKPVSAELLEEEIRLWEEVLSVQTEIPLPCSVARPPFTTFVPVWGVVIKRKITPEQVIQLINTLRAVSGCQRIPSGEVAWAYELFDELACFSPARSVDVRV